MSERTIIAWTDHTFNLAWGCWKISPGCAHCYADMIANSGRTAFRQNGQIIGVWGKDRPRRTFGEEHWREPLRWNRRARQEGRRHRVFCSSMTDWALDDETIAGERAKLWPLIAATPWLDWQLLTKRAERIADCLPGGWGEGWPNVWLGVSVENMDYACRVESLRRIPASVRFISYEPALGPLHGIDLKGVDWVIFGGESGVGRRDADLQWSRDMRDHCRRNGVAYFHKQSSHRFTERGTLLDGESIKEFPAPRHVLCAAPSA